MLRFGTILRGRRRGLPFAIALSRFHPRCICRCHIRPLIRKQTLKARRKKIGGAKVLVLNLVYARDIDDLRETPGLTIIELLRRRGAEVSYNNSCSLFRDVDVIAT